MKRLLNTLYVTTEGAYPRKDGETVAVEIDGVTRTRLPAHLLDRIVMFGETAMWPGLMTHAAGTGLSVAWLTWSGKLAGRLEGPQTGNVLLRRAHHRMTDDGASPPSARRAPAARPRTPGPGTTPRTVSPPRRLRLPRMAVGMRATPAAG